MKCGRCDVDYPDELLSPMIVNGLNTVDICGICAITITNEIHGKHRIKFTDGSMAEIMRLDALEHRQKTNQKPKK